MARDERAMTDFVEQTAAAMAAAGFPRMPARVLMALIAAESTGLTAKELSDELGASPRRSRVRCATCRPSAWCIGSRSRVRVAMSTNCPSTPGTR